MSILTILAAKYREGGINYFKKLVVNNLKYIFGEYIFSVKKVFTAERSLDLPIDEVTPKINTEIREFRLEDIDKLKNMVSEKKLELFRHRLNDEGFTGFVALNSDKEIMSFAWITYKDDIDPNTKLKICVKENEGILFDDVTFPNWRGNKLQTFLIYTRILYLKRNLFNKVLVGYLENNTFSRKSYQRNDFTETLRTIIINIFTIKIKFPRKLK